MVGVRLPSTKKIDGATRILNEIRSFRKEYRMSYVNKKSIDSAITYLANNKGKMVYHKNVSANMPIGSGVTEAACKVLVKQRMCRGSVKWKEQGASVVLTLRSLHTTAKRWAQFWGKYSQYGF